MEPRHFAEAIDRLSRIRSRSELTRAHLIFGEWPRRRNRRPQAGEDLQTAYEIFATIGMAGIVERARCAMRAAGETVRVHTADARHSLTARETQIARLAADGRTSPEIGAELFVSPRIVERPPRKFYPKLGMTSRKVLQMANSSRPSVI